MTGVAESWRISRNDVRLAEGILLFLASREMIGQFNCPMVPLQPAPPAAVMSLAIPTIVSP